MLLNLLAFYELRMSSIIFHLIKLDEDKDNDGDNDSHGGVDDGYDDDNASSK